MDGQRLNRRDKARMYIKHEVSDTPSGFSHRIVGTPTLPDETEIASPAVGYEAISILEFAGERYYAVTDYYEGSFPTNVVFTASVAVGSSSQLAG